MPNALVVCVCNRMNTWTKRLPWIVGGVGTVGFIGRYLNTLMTEDIPKRYPYIQMALPDDRLLWYKKVHYDSLNESAHATVYTDTGKTIRICARKIFANTTQTPEDLDAHYDEEDLGGIAYYWENPWEVKTLLRNLVNDLMRKLPTRMGEEFTPSEWELVCVCVDDLCVIGEKLAHPDFASEHFKTLPDTRTKIVLGSMAFFGFFFGVKRGYTYWRMWPSYKFAQSYIMSHPVVKQFYSKGDITIISRTGTFTSKLIDTEITLTGTETAAGESVVKLEASKTKTGWMIGRATLTPQGCKSIDLLGVVPRD